MPYMDWNRNGAMDPVDIGISVATEEAQKKAEKEGPTEEKQKALSGCLGLILIVLNAIGCICVFLVIA